tara:strand:- start:284 stop:919 length:636 start_codon:yes stop_codon:yes gene_type:complete
MSEFGYIPEAPEQSFGNNKGIFTPKDIYDLTRADKYTNYGQLELIETQTVSSVAQVDFTAIQESTYNVHFLTVNNYQANTDNTILTIDLFENGVLETSNYQVAIQGGRADGTFSEYKSTSSTNGIANIGSGIDNASASSANGYCYFYNLGDSTKYSFSTYQWSYIYYTNVYEMNFGSGVLPQASTVDGFRVIPNAGTFSADFSLYGIKEYS